MLQVLIYYYYDCRCASDISGCGPEGRGSGLGTASAMACSANHSKGSGHGSSSQHGSGLIVGPNAWLQRKVHLRPQHRGVHLVTDEILRGVSHTRGIMVSPHVTSCFSYPSWPSSLSASCTSNSFTRAPPWRSTRTGTRTWGTTWRWCSTESYPKIFHSDTPARGRMTWWVVTAPLMILTPCTIAARSREGLLPRLQLDGPRVRREAEPGHLAGGVAVWAQGQGGQQKGEAGHHWPPGENVLTVIHHWYRDSVGCLMIPWPGAS